MHLIDVIALFNSNSNLKHIQIRIKTKYKWVSITQADVMPVAVA